MSDPARAADYLMRSWPQWVKQLEELKERVYGEAMVADRERPIFDKWVRLYHATAYELARRDYMSLPRIPMELKLDIYLKMHEIGKQMLQDAKDDSNVDESKVVKARDLWVDYTMKHEHHIYDYARQSADPETRLQLWEDFLQRREQEFDETNALRTEALRAGHDDGSMDVFVRDSLALYANHFKRITQEVVSDNLLVDSRYKDHWKRIHDLLTWHSMLLRNAVNKGGNIFVPPGQNPLTYDVADLAKYASAYNAHYMNMLNVQAQTGGAGVDIAALRNSIATAAVSSTPTQQPAPTATASPLATATQGEAVAATVRRPAGNIHLRNDQRKVVRNQTKPDGLCLYHALYGATAQIDPALLQRKKIKNGKALMNYIKKAMLADIRTSRRMGGWQSPWMELWAQTEAPPGTDFANLPRDEHLQQQLEEYVNRVGTVFGGEIETNLWAHLAHIDFDTVVQDTEDEDHYILRSSTNLYPTENRRAILSHVYGNLSNYQNYKSNYDNEMKQWQQDFTHAQRTSNVIMQNRLNARRPQFFPHNHYEYLTYPDEVAQGYDPTVSAGVPPAIPAPMPVGTEATEIIEPSSSSVTRMDEEAAEEEDESEVINPPSLVTFNITPDPISNKERQSYNSFKTKTLFRWMDQQRENAIAAIDDLQASHANGDGTFSHPMYNIRSLRDVLRYDYEGIKNVDSLYAEQLLNAYPMWNVPVYLQNVNNKIKSYMSTNNHENVSRALLRKMHHDDRGLKSRMELGVHYDDSQRNPLYRDIVYAYPYMSRTLQWDVINRAMSSYLSPQEHALYGTLKMGSRINIHIPWGTASDDLAEMQGLKQWDQIKYYLPHELFGNRHFKASFFDHIGIPLSDWPVISENDKTAHVDVEEMDDENMDVTREVMGFLDDPTEDVVLDGGMPDAISSSSTVGIPSQDRASSVGGRITRPVRTTSTMHPYDLKRNKELITKITQNMRMLKQGMRSSFQQENEAQYWYQLYKKTQNLLGKVKKPGDRDRQMINELGLLHAQMDALNEFAGTEILDHLVNDRMAQKYQSSTTLNDYPPTGQLGLDNGIDDQEMDDQGNRERQRLRKEIEEYKKLWSDFHVPPAGVTDDMYNRRATLRSQEVLRAQNEPFMADERQFANDLDRVRSVEVDPSNFKSVLKDMVNLSQRINQNGANWSPGMHMLWNQSVRNLRQLQSSAVGPASRTRMQEEWANIRVTDQASITEGYSVGQSSVFQPGGQAEPWIDVFNQKTKRKYKNVIQSIVQDIQNLRTNRDSYDRSSFHQESTRIGEKIHNFNSVEANTPMDARTRLHTIIRFMRHELRELVHQRVQRDLQQENLLDVESTGSHSSSNSDNGDDDNGDDDDGGDGGGGDYGQTGEGPDDGAADDETGGDYEYDGGDEEYDHPQEEFPSMIDKGDERRAAEQDEEAKLYTLGQQPLLLGPVDDSRNVDVRDPVTTLPMRGRTVRANQYWAINQQARRNATLQSRLHSYMSPAVKRQVARTQEYYNNVDRLARYVRELGYNKKAGPDYPWDDYHAQLRAEIEQQLPMGDGNRRRMLERLNKFEEERLQVSALAGPSERQRALEDEPPRERPYPKSWYKPQGPLKVVPRPETSPPSTPPSEQPMRPARQRGPPLEQLPELTKDYLEYLARTMKQEIIADHPVEDERISLPPRRIVAPPDDERPGLPPRRIVPPSTPPVDPFDPFQGPMERLLPPKGGDLDVLKIKNRIKRKIKKPKKPTRTTDVQMAEDIIPPSSTIVLPLVPPAVLPQPLPLAPVAPAPIVAPGPPPPPPPNPASLVVPPGDSVPVAPPGRVVENVIGPPQPNFPNFVIPQPEPLPLVLPLDISRIPNPQPLPQVPVAPAPIAAPGPPPPPPPNPAQPIPVYIPQAPPQRVVENWYVPPPANNTPFVIPQPQPGPLILPLSNNNIILPQPQPGPQPQPLIIPINSNDIIQQPIAPPPGPPPPPPPQPQPNDDVGGHSDDAISLAEDPFQDVEEVNVNLEVDYNSDDPDRMGLGIRHPIRARRGGTIQRHRVNPGVARDNFYRGVRDALIDAKIYRPNNRYRTDYHLFSFFG